MSAASATSTSSTPAPSFSTASATPGTSPTPGARFRAAVAQGAPLQVVGVINAYAALLAEHSGHRAIYLSGGGVAASSCAVPDLGITTLEDVLVDTRRITARSELPLLVDIDTGWGGRFNIARAIRELTRAGAAAVHIEDQVQAKRCGHRPGKAIVPTEEMVDRIRAAVDARQDASFVIMARTDALSSEGLTASVERAQRYVEAGADMLFPEAMETLDMYRRFTQAVQVPVLANITEFGKTPLFTTQQLHQAGIQLVLYPLSAFRAGARAMLNVYQHLAQDGTQQAVLASMQTREELYEHLGYHAFESQLDADQQADARRA